jgi:K+-sensing histidine kinase KdpD
MKTRTNLFFILLSIYVVLQFLWWGYHLIDLSQRVELNSAISERRVLMILGEGAVFFALLIYGIWRIRKSIQKDIRLSLRQTNFILSITHELKTPLASIKILVQTLLKHDLNAEKRNELLKKALEENTRLELMIENILQAANLENKSLKPEKSLFIFSAFCQEIIDRYHKTHGTPFIKLQLAEDAELNADRFMMEVIIINLLENAIKYAGIDSNIVIYCRHENNAFIFGVKDNGPGIHVAQREPIFNKFYRIGNEETRTQKGSGLGLYLVKQFTELHKGKISCLENQPVGADFQITLHI